MCFSLEQCCASHRRSPRAKAGDLQIPPERPTPCLRHLDVGRSRQQPTSDGHVDAGRVDVERVDVERVNVGRVRCFQHLRLPPQPVCRFCLPGLCWRRAQAIAMLSLQRSEPPSCRLLRLCGAAASHNRVNSVEDQLQRWCSTRQQEPTWVGCGQALHAAIHCAGIAIDLQSRRSICEDAEQPSA